MALTEGEFRSHNDAALTSLNRALDAVIEEHDIEVTFQNGVLAISIEGSNPGKIVISPQAPTRQVWISAKSTSFKLDWSGSAFVFPGTGESLNHLVSRFIAEHLGVAKIEL